MNRKMLISLLICLWAVFLMATGAQTAEKKKDAKNEFAGSKACAKCHKDAFESWNKTLHSKMVMKKDDGILKAAVEKWATDGKNPGPAKGNVTKKEFKMSDVEYVVGSHWKQRYLVKNEITGGYQLMDRQFNRMSGEWEPYGNANDWDQMCATCHTTGYRMISYDPANPQTAKATWSELNVGCESCHGPAAKHVRTKSKKDIFNPTKLSKQEQSRMCGYCHIRAENEKYKSPQGNPREDLPAPKVGDAFKPWDDWTKWYPEEVVIPGVQPEDKIDVEYKGDLKGIFILDDISKKNGVYDEGKHHQEYQGLIQSKHFSILSCVDCHAPHAGKHIKPKVAKETCKTCHGDTYNYEKIMPGTGGTAKNLTVRTHTFFKGQNRPSKPIATGTAEFNKK